MPVAPRLRKDAVKWMIPKTIYHYDYPMSSEVDITLKIKEPRENQATLGRGVGGGERRKEALLLLRDGGKTLSPK